MPAEPRAEPPTVAQAVRRAAETCEHDGHPPEPIADWLVDQAVVL